MLLVALTGGIGSGKSSVSERLARRGAIILDADRIVRDLQRPGEPVFAAMVARWGSKIVAGDGELDRGAVAAIVFADDDELQALNEIVHPVVHDVMVSRLEELSTSDSVVIQDIPLLAESADGDKEAAKRGSAAIIVVDCPVDVAIDRLVRFRGFKRDDASARIAAQASREERTALADFLIDNGGTIERLDVEVDRCWEWLRAGADVPQTS